MKNNKEKISYDLIFDLDGRGLALLVQKKRAVNKKISKETVYQKRSLFGQGALVSKKDSAHVFVSALRDLLGSVQLLVDSDIDSVHVFAASPWLSSRQTSQKIIKDQDFLVDQRLLTKLISSLDEKSIFVDELSFVERRLVDVTLNGYPSSNPLGKKTKELEVKILVSAISNDFKNLFEHEVERFFIAPISWSSRSFLHYSLLQEIIPHEDDLLVLDVGGDDTDISLIKSDHIESLLSFNSGLHTIIRSLSHRLHVSFQKAESLIKMLASGSIHGAAEESLRKHLAEAYKLWLREFYSSLQNLGKDGLVPSTLCLIVDEGLESWFAEALLSTTELREHIAFDSKIKLISYRGRFIDFSAKNEIEIHSPDTHLNLSHYFFNKNEL